MPKKSNASNTQNMQEPQENQSITAKMTELNQKIEWFYSDEFSLDQATTKYKEATDLAKNIEHDLADLKNEIEIISKDFTKD